MKQIKIALFSTLALGLTLTSCGDDDSKSNNAPSLIGKWTYSKEGEIVDGKETLNDHPHAAGCSKDYVEFTATTLTSVEYEGSQCTEHKDAAPYVKNGNSIVVTFNGESETAEIVALTATTLKIKTTYTDEGVVEIYVDEYTRQ